MQVGNQVRLKQFCLNTQLNPEGTLVRFLNDRASLMALRAKRFVLFFIWSSVMP
jgi:hypothetical protein